MTTIYICLGIAAACVAAMFFIVATAPRGYQDEKGFHYGKPPEDR